jgi:hypothetical protein
MLKSGKNIFQNPTTYLYVSGVVALAALIISIIAMFTNDCKKSPFGDIMINGQPGKASLNQSCVPISKYSIACEPGMDPYSVCMQGLTCKGIGGDQHGKCINTTILNPKKDCTKINPQPQPRNCSNICNLINKESDCTHHSSGCPCSWDDENNRCIFGGGTGQGVCPSSMCCNPNNPDSDDDCKQGFICSQDTSPRGKCKDTNCSSVYSRKCVPKGSCGPGLIYDKESGDCVASDTSECQGHSFTNCKSPDCEWNYIDYPPHGACVISGSSGSGSSGSGSDIIKKHINIRGNTVGGGGGIRQNSTQSSAPPPQGSHGHPPPGHSPSHSPSPSGPSGPSDSDDLTWLWITLGSVGGLVLLGLIIFFVTRNSKMRFGRPRMMGFGRPYPR